MIDTAAGRNPAARQWRARQPFIESWRDLGLYAGRAIVDEIVDGLERHAHTPVVFSYEERVEETTAGELWAASAPVAAGLAARGVGAGDAIVNQLPSSREHMLLFLAAMRLGAVIVPVVDIYGPAELGYVVRACRARVLALPARWRNIDFAARLGGLGDTPDLEYVVAVGHGDLPGSTLPWDDVAAHRGTEPARPDPHPDSVCLLNFTSGTTADPKGVMHSHHSLIAAARLHPSLCVEGSDAPIIRFGPAGHVGVIMSLLRPFLLGDEHVYVDRFDPRVVAELCDRYGASRTNAVPTHVTTLLDAGGGRLPASLTYLLLGGTSVPVPLMERLDDLGLHVVRTWGMSEQPVTTAGIPSEPFARRGHTDGRPVRGNVVRAVDDRGRDVPPGEPGDLITMGPQMFRGFLDASLDDDAFTADGFYRTGDIGTIDGEGYVTIVDRKKDIVVRGGENISSREVEELLLRHPAVREAAVVAFPDRRLGERVGAFVRLVDGTTLTLDDVQAHFVTLGVARQKTPEHLVVVDDFPRTAAGKIVKAELRKDLEARCGSS